MASSSWDPDQYQRFASERRRPFDDLVGALEPVPGGRVVDLGCGPGTLTIDLHRAVRAAHTVGVDDAEPMLEVARAALAQATATDPGLDGVSFAWGHLQDYVADPAVELVFANASLQWAPDHPHLLAHLADQLVAGGQLAFQVPANHDHPSHQVADDLGREQGLVVSGGAANVLAPEDYATVLHDLGLVDVDVRLQVYGFELDHADDLVEWTKGTLLTGYRAQLEPAAYDAFVDEYRSRLARRVGPKAPYYYAFKRILAWARRPD
jgi:trans-aconitate 2-methyltransferase